MRNTIATLFLCVLLAGCAQRGAWYKAWATQETYNGDSSACEKEVREGRRFGDVVTGRRREKYERCMEARGWAERPRGQGFMTVSPP